ncbi:MAG: 2-phosphosulfolactate phosphatase [Chitinophagaceae bacterium]|nr:2-phosphosulfolactate phosphatase [Chitinophagaceae bacterium]MCB9045644.1 2-phosphosulfolactate phosphatase [Chitinophagales bacterium]
MNRELPRLEVCLSPALLHLFDTEGSVVVIIDVFRATSTIAAALYNNAKSVWPVATVEECIEIGNKVENSITAGERNGKVVEGLQHGNSPSEYSREFVEGKTLVLTTTNGTRLLHMVKGASAIITGSFLNLSAVSEFLLQQNKNVLLACAAWKDRFNLEDALFAGAVIDKVKDSFYMNCDSAKAAVTLYNSLNGVKPIDFLRDSSHYRRLSAYGLESDMEYCASIDLHPVVPYLKDNQLVIYKD